MVRTITLHHVFNVLENESGKTVKTLKLPKNTYSPKAARKVLEENGFNEKHSLVYDYPVQEKRELSDEDFIKYSKIVK